LAEQGKVVFTQIPVEFANIEEISTGNYRYAAGMGIAVAEMSNSLEEHEILTSDFFSARAPEISFDGKLLVFSAQKTEGDVWQIWTMGLESRKTNQVTESETNCTDPAWLPDERIVFSKQINENGITHHALYTIGMDGCCEQRISFHPHEDLNANVLHDGRILISSQQVYPEPGIIKYLAMRPDGTKAELFYQSDKNHQLGKANEDEAGHVLFTESGVLNSIKFNRPLHSGNVIQEASVGIVHSIFPISGETILASVKKPDGQTFGLANIGESQKDKGAFYYSHPEYHAVEPLIIKERPLSRKLPTRVNTELETGYFLCMDADQSELVVDNVEAGTTAKVRVLGLDDTLGEVEVSEDGSFYLELKADQPVRFQSLNDAGEVLRGPSSWMWVRPNERRGCVGCHEDREIAPENVVPKAVEKAPFAMIK
jgi:hypothetical protein